MTCKIVAQRHSTVHDSTSCRSAEAPPGPFELTDNASRATDLDRPTCFPDCDDTSLRGHLAGAGPEMRYPRGEGRCGTRGRMQPRPPRTSRFAGDGSLTTDDNVQSTFHGSTSPPSRRLSVIRMPDHLVTPRRNAAAFISAVSTASDEDIEADLRRINGELAATDRHLSRLADRRANLVLERKVLSEVRVERSRPSYRRPPTPPNGEGSSADLPPAAWWPLGPRTGVELHLRSNYGRIIGCVAAGLRRAHEVRDALGMQQTTVQEALKKLTAEGYLTRDADRPEFTLDARGHAAFKELATTYGWGGQPADASADRT